MKEVTFTEFVAMLRHHGLLEGKLTVIGYPGKGGQWRVTRTGEALGWELKGQKYFLCL